MPDDKTKKKLDRKRISLKQPAEVSYLKKIAKEIIKKRLSIRINLLTSDIWYDSRKGMNYCKKAERIAKALLKCLNKK